MIRGVSFDCDTPGCWAYCQISARAVASAFGMAVEKYGWSQRDGKHYCGPCTRGEHPHDAAPPGTVVDLAAAPLPPYYDSDEAERMTTSQPAKGNTMPEHADNLDTTEDRPDPLEGHRRVVWVEAEMPVPPVITAVLTDEDAAYIRDYILTRRVA